MYINFEGSSRKTVDLASRAYEISHAVESKTEGHIGTIYFIRDANSVGSIEWCKGNKAKGFGVKIDLEELFDLLETREAGTGE